MPIALVTGPANAGKARVLLEAVRGHVARDEEPLLIVPTEADQARYQRELAEGGLALGARVERFEGLLAEVLARAGDARAPLGPLAREHLLARLANARPGMARELAALAADLETQRVTPARLRGALRASRAEGQEPGGQAPPLERLCTVFERYQQTLTQMRRSDRELRATRALDELRRKPASWGAVPVLLYGFDDFTELQIDTILTLGDVVDAPVTVSLAYEPGRVVFVGRASTFQRLAPLADFHTELRARADHYAPPSREALYHLERSLLSDDPQQVEPGEAVRLLEGGGPRAELELVAGEVRALLDGGVAAQEIAIVHRSPESIAGLLGEVLEDLEIPYAQRRCTMFADTAVGHGLLGMLRCTTEVGELGDLLAWLGAPGVLERPELLDRFERSARRQGVLDSSRARALWEAENWPLERIDRVREAAATGTPELLDALTGELQRLFCAPRGSTASVLEEDERDEARALVGARRALEELRELARAAPEFAPSAGELIELLERLELTAGEHLEPGRVAVLDPLSLRARRVRMVFACGLQEGIFPTTATPHPLLQDHQRRELAQGSGLVLRGEPDALAAERYLLYALASRPLERLTLSWHVADEQGTPIARSLFVEDICDLFTATLRERTVRRVAGAADWPGPGRPAGAMATRAAAISTAADSAAAPTSPIAPLRDERMLGEMRERVLWSASSLESWTGCPVKWFVERLLRADDIEPDPEPLKRGGLAHAALKDTLERLRERSGSARLTSASVGLAKRLLAEALLELEPNYPLSVAPERLPGARRRLQVDLERYLECAAEQASPLEPTYLELEFGFEAEAREEHAGEDGGALPALQLGDGVLLRGRIDRVDLGSAGEAVVYDYKGRSAPPAARWLGDGAFQLALYMRAVEALLDRTAVGGFYQPLAGRDIRARGVLDGDSAVELECVRTDRLEHEQMRGLIDQCLATALRAAGEARSGALVPRPDTCAYNGGCAYPTICRCEQ
ncbi:MAG TPA: PD-(D/E)XK nuclease family protein [Solirubrobacteraceae bacterium]|jgi:ATP-dependent helicase/DNAse subunit B|nr:PD-(D/E)XK nuclease family protein [Solirubrobacteraceae bacterium]